MKIDALCYYSTSSRHLRDFRIELPPEPIILSSYLLNPNTIHSPDKFKVANTSGPRGIMVSSALPPREL